MIFPWVPCGIGFPLVLWVPPPRVLSGLSSGGFRWFRAVGVPWVLLVSVGSVSFRGVRVFHGFRGSYGLRFRGFGFGSVGLRMAPLGVQMNFQFIIKLHQIQMKSMDPVADPRWPERAPKRPQRAPRRPQDRAFCRALSRFGVRRRMAVHLRGPLAEVAHLPPGLRGLRGAPVAPG